MEQCGNEEELLTPDLPHPDEADPLDGLSPRHRRLCLLAAEGVPATEICRTLGYTNARVSILLGLPLIRAEIRRIQDRIYEEPAAQRMKDLREKAFAFLTFALTDNTNHVKEETKARFTTWLLEMTEGKASQKIDVGENTLAALFDRLDAEKVRSREVSAPTDIEIKAMSAAPEKDPLVDWFDALEAREAQTALRKSST